MSMSMAVNEFLDDMREGRMTEAPIVTVEQGQLQGRVVTSPSGKAFYSFQGIPYAKPPLGSLRFKAPQPPEPWEGIRDATSEGNVSAQIDLITQEYTGDENSLFLNVYTTNLDGAFLPVMIFIHGGGFRFGSGSSKLYGGDYLVEKDVILVTLNYRLGPLGFLSLHTPDVPGNAGMKDIAQAIRWIKENIQNFGGNPGNLTIFGESAGGAAVSLLTASPLTKDLVNKAIVQSGTALSNWTLQRDPLENARKLAKHLGCESSDPNDIYEFLVTTPVKDIILAYEESSPREEFLSAPENLSTIVVEKEYPGVEAFITESFIDYLTSGRVSNIPVMIGSTTLELASKVEEDLQFFIPSDLNIERNSPEALAVAEKIKELYFKDSQSSVEEYYELLSDKYFNIDTHRHVQYLVQVSKKPVYYYKFGYVGELNVSKRLLLTRMTNTGHNKAMHMDELGYIFKNDLQHGVEPTSQDIKMRERMLRLWTNFAKSGNPTPDESHLITITWLPVTRDNLYYMELDTELSLGSNPSKEKMEFWDELYNKHFRIWEQPKANISEVHLKETPEPQTTVESVVIVSETIVAESPEPEIVEKSEPVVETPTPVVENSEPVVETPEPVIESPPNTTSNEVHVNGNEVDKKPRTSNEIKMVQQSNGGPKDVIRANDPPEDDLPKNIGVNKFVNFFESLGGKK